MARKFFRLILASLLLIGVMPVQALGLDCVANSVDQASSCCCPVGQQTKQSCCEEESSADAESCNCLHDPAGEAPLVLAAAQPYHQLLPAVLPDTASTDHEILLGPGSSILWPELDAPPGNSESLDFSRAPPCV
ncbi:hypothetical protein QM565_27000 [Geitlerinema splendidum]|nr:hypothetical protein [Geitlerinema splendidum]